MFVTVLKAGKIKRPNWGKTRTPRRLSKLSLASQKAIRMDLVKGVKAFKKKVPDPEVIYEAWIKGGYAGIVETIPWHEMHKEIVPATKRTWSAMTQVIGIAGEALPSQIKAGYRFDYKNPRIERVWRERAGEWMVDPLINDGKKSIQQIVHRQFTEGLNPKDLAGDIRGYVGLYPKLANSLTNYKRSLAEKGVPIENQIKWGNAYEDKLLDYRAMMIARTETNFMINRGQLEVWRQGQDNGLIPLEATKVWLADGNPCEECSEMDGEEVGLAESWVTPSGDVCEIPTEIHPNCECTMTINYGDQEQDDEEDNG